jgi:PTS system ascorbate-specific IIC component
MDFLMNILSYLANYVLGVPAIMIAMVAMIGLIAQKKDFSEVVAGTMKSAMGYLILGTGAGLLVNSMVPLGGIMNQVFGFNGFFPNDESIVSAVMGTYGKAAVLSMVIGFIVNLIVARFTKFKYVMLTGHIMLFTNMLVVVLLQVQLGWTNMLQIVITSGIIVGIYHPLTIALVQKYTDKVTGNAGIGFGHSSNFQVWLGGFLGEKFGDSSKSTEDLNLPRWASMFRDASLATGFTMFLVFLFVAFVAPSDYMLGQTGEQGRFMWAVMNGLSFGAGITVLLSGVRMLIGEIVPAFKGFSDLIVPEAKPGLDCPVVMPYAPTAWLLGFLISFPIGIIITLISAGPMNVQYVLIAGVIPHFFGSGPAAVYGNATGGLKGAIIASVASSIIMSFGIQALIPLTGDVCIGTGLTWGESEYGVWGLIFGYVLKLINTII